MISSLISDSASSDSFEVYPPVKIPAELCQTNCSGTIIDTWFRRDLDNDSLKEELSKSDVVILVYDITRPETIDRLSSFWCEFICKHTKSPILIVGNKADQKPNCQSESIEDIMRNIAVEFKQCEMILECSATSMLNISEVYTCAQKIFLYPTAPLYNSVSKQLTEEFKRALVLIFRRCDRDKDFFLNDKELILMHSDIFHTVLEEEDVGRIKEVIKQECPLGVEEKGINILGFYHLQEMMIKRLKINVCWTLLKYYGFDYKLDLSIEFTLKKNSEQSVELSKASIVYLQRLFELYADNGKLLTFEAFREIFSAAACPPWDVSNFDPLSWREIYELVPTDSEYLTLHSWLSLWHMLTLKDYHTALIYFIYTGCEIIYNEMFLVTNEREIMEMNYRRVHCGFVLATEDTEKAWIVTAFLDNRIELDNSRARWSCRMVEEGQVAWESKYLVLAFFPYKDPGVTKMLNLCDVGIIMSKDKEFNDFEELLPSTLAKIRVDTERYIEEYQIRDVFINAYRFSCRPFDGLEEEVKNKLMRNRKSKRNMVLQVIGALAIAVGALGLIAFKKIKA